MIIENKIKIGWLLGHIWLALLSVSLITACGGAAIQTPSPVPPTPEPTQAPTVTPTPAPTATPSLAPTSTPRSADEISLVWDTSGGVRPSDADDVSAIVAEVMRKEGILNGYGNEQGLTLQYDPMLITVEEIQELLRSMGHPVRIRQ